MSNILIIGSGFSSLAASCYLAKAGHNVTVLEKNNTIGGRARQLKRDGFTFDIGPTFYWMPDVFEKFFNDFETKAEDYYHLDRLDPAYQVYFGKEDSISIAADIDSIKATFEQNEKGSATKLTSFLKLAKSNYDIAIKDLVYKPGVHLFELARIETFLKLGQFVSSIRTQVAKTVNSPKLKKILEFPVLFLGAKPDTTPGFYNFMNFADFVLGTWHPRGGMYEVVEGIGSLAKSLGVTFKTNCTVDKINVDNKSVNWIESSHGILECDVLLSGADYHHTETLLDTEYRQYSEDYWNKKTFAPSALLFYVGFSKKLENLSHHTLFFDTEFDLHAKSIYDTKEWPEKPLFYASFPSKTDPTTAPEGKEAGIFLIPLAPDLNDTEEIREKYFEKLLDRLETLTNQKLRKDIIFKESYCVNDFKADYNSYKGNAYGLANTLLQTHILRPKIKSKKVNNLFFTGQLTVPGPGVPPSLISGKIAADMICKEN